MTINSKMDALMTDINEVCKKVEPQIEGAFTTIEGTSHKAIPYATRLDKSMANTAAKSINTAKQGEFSPRQELNNLMKRVNDLTLELSKVDDPNLDLAKAKDFLSSAKKLNDTAIKSRRVVNVSRSFFEWIKDGLLGLFGIDHNSHFEKPSSNFGNIESRINERHDFYEKIAKKK